MAALLLGGGLLLSAAGAQAPLKLDDLFTTPTLSVPATPLPIEEFPTTLAGLNEKNAPRYLAHLEEEFGRGNFDPVLAGTELLLAWFDPKAPEYQDAMLLRARTYKAQSDHDRLLNIARNYLTRFAEGKHSPWFLAELASELDRRKEFDSSAAVWRMILDRKLRLEPEQALAGAETLNRTLHAGEARGLLLMISSRVADPEVQSRRAALLVESLLLKDDTKVEIPGAREGAAAFNFRRALLLESRMKYKEATAEFGRLAAEGVQLTPAQQQLLEQRLAALQKKHWPPTRDVPAPTPTP